MKKNDTFFGENLYYHIFNRGVEKRDIFIDTNDYNRFIFLMLILQSEKIYENAYRLARRFDAHQMCIMKDIETTLETTRGIELVSFILMPNHFHFIVRGVNENGISKFIQRLCNSYAKYFNQKYKRSGHLFGSKYHRKLVDTNEYLLHLSAYIHYNPHKLSMWKNKEYKYPWSSYQDFIFKKRWGKFLDSSIILNQFNNTEEYKKFVQTYASKELGLENEMMDI